MKIDLYTITWNDRVMLKYFLTHYAPWVDRIIVFDDHSDDSTREIATAHPKVELRDLPEKGESFVETALGIWNHAWKESRGRADWVIVGNLDEFFYHPAGERAFIEAAHAKHFTVIHPRGFEMYGDAFPLQGSSIIHELPCGTPMFGQDKMQIFNPNAIAEMRFTPGRHTAKPQGRVTINTDDNAHLLHYKYVDTEGYLVPRQQSLRDRMLPGDVARGYGFQYRLGQAEIMSSAAWLKRHSMRVVQSHISETLPT